VKKLWNMLVLTLALNFLLLAGGVGYLYKTGRLDPEKLHAIRELVFPAVQPGDPSTRPTTAPSTQPVLSLDALLAEHAGMPAVEQVQLLQRTFDSRLAQLDRRQREVEALHDLVRNAEAKLSAERAEFDAQRAALETREQEAARLAGDKGFQEALQLYQTMKPKQVKDVFAGMADDAVVRYLRAMEPRQATKVLKEFKTPAEVRRVKLLMERVEGAPAEPGGASTQQ
jgi:flagellar motility protein MotE (MotC chaperone)